MRNDQSRGKNQAASGTDIDEVKKLNSESGLTYNQVKQLLGKQYFNKK
ncbi:hypothetical protein AAEO50_04585 [Rossellomorea oryzaecorticis]|uniref:Uncharacterized protein n=1 Tax=Rossellomorea oryzaecorticis TaxID=1396505 RepID=A0ABU9K641_9BACI